MHRLTLVCDDSQAREIAGLAEEYGLTEREVLRQLLDAGIESVQGGADPTPRLRRH